MAESSAIKKGRVTMRRLEGIQAPVQLTGHPRAKGLIYSLFEEGAKGLLPSTLRHGDIQGSTIKPVTQAL